MRRDIALFILRNPEKSFVTVGRTLLLPVLNPAACISFMITYAGGMGAFLKKYAGKEACDELIAKAIRASDIRRSRGNPHIVKRRTTIPLPSPEVRCLTPDFLPGRLAEFGSVARSLTARECQWVVTSAPPYYCGEEVDGLYCKTHDAIRLAREQAAEEQVRSR